MNVSKRCEVCKRPFVPYREYQKYCSDACRVKAGIDKRKLYKKNSIKEKICPICEKIFKTNVRNKRFCSTKCYEEARLNGFYYQKKKAHVCTCANCGKEFETTHGIQKYCSQKCYIEAASKRRKEQAHVYPKL